MIMEENVQYKSFSISSDLLYGYIEMTFMWLWSTPWRSTL